MTEELGRLVTAILVGIGGAVGLATFLKATLEYVLQARQKRMEMYLDLEKRLLENEDFKRIRDLLHAQTPGNLQALAQIDWNVRNDFAGFFETIAIMVKGKLMSPSVACYMFSNTAVELWNTDAFWTGFARESTYWWILEEFVHQMERLRSRLALKGVVPVI